jgi:flagellar motor switch protein FliG
MSRQAVTQQKATPVRPRGIDKVMFVLLALGKDKASRLLALFEPSEIDAIARAAPGIRSIDGAVFRDVAIEFETSFENAMEFLGTPNEVLGLLEKDETAAITTSAEPRNIVGFWSSVAGLSNERLVAYVAAQHPQVIAYIMSNLERGRAAEVLQEFLPPQRNDVLLRMLQLRAIAPEVRDRIDAGIADDLLETKNAPVAHHASIAEILNQLDQKQSHEVLQHIERQQPKDAVIVKKMLFKFEDVVSLAPKALAVVVDQVPVDKMVIALQGMSDEFKGILLSVMSPRSRRMVESELQAGSAMSARDIAAARRNIAAIVLKLATEGAIQLGTADTLAPETQALPEGRR